MKKLYTIFAMVMIITVANSQNTVNQQWVQLYNGPDSLNDGSFSIDYQGNVYVTGASQVPPFTPQVYKITTIKYSPSGAILWIATYDSISNASFNAIAMKVDSFGNVYVTGSVINNQLNGTTDIVTLKYDSNGNLLWSSLYANPLGKQDEPRAIDIDNSGNTYVTGFCSDSATVASSANKDFCTIKYNSIGVQQWVVQYNDSIINLDDVANDIAVDNSGNSYITGFSYVNSTTRDIVTIKYNANGIQQWLTKYDGGNDDFANKLALDTSNNIFVTGASIGSSAEDYIIIKYNNSGAQQWTATHNGTGNASDIAQDISIDNYQEIIITGATKNNITGFDYTTIKYDTAGTELWSAIYNGTGNGTDKASSLSLDIVGNIYITGQSVGITTGDDYATVKYSPNGVLQWTIRFDGVANGSDVATDIKATANGEVYITGYSHNGTDYDFATIKYSQDTIALSFNVTNAKCYGTSDGKIDLSVTGGLSPYTYLWSNGKMTEDIDSLQAGTHSVTVTDNISNVSTNSINIVQPVMDNSSAFAALNNLGQCNDLFISEYIEGSGKNRAIELFNSSNGCRNLSQYSIKIFPNANPNNPNIIPLSGAITPAEAFSCCHDQASANIKGKSKMVCSCIDFDGNDAVGLYKNDTLIDMIGQVGNTPGQNGWQVGTGFTKDNTLIRKWDVHNGTPYWNLAQLEYSVHTTDYSDSLGKHEGVCSVFTIQFSTNTGQIDEGSDYPVVVQLSNPDGNNDHYADITISSETTCIVIPPAPDDPPADCPYDFELTNLGDGTVTTQCQVFRVKVPKSSSGIYGTGYIKAKGDGNPIEGLESICLSITGTDAGSIKGTTILQTVYIIDKAAVGINQIGKDDKIKIFIHNDQITIKSGDISINNIGIYNALGQLLINESVFSNTFDIGNLATGIYLVRLASSDNIYWAKILK